MGEGVGSMGEEGGLGVDGRMVVRGLEGEGGRGGWGVLMGGGLGMGVFRRGSGGGGRGCRRGGVGMREGEGGVTRDVVMG